MIDNQSNKDLFEHYKIVYIRNTQNRKWRLQLENNWNTKNATNPAVFFKNLRPAIKDGAIAYEYVGEKSEPTPK